MDKTITEETYKVDIARLEAQIREYQIQKEIFEQSISYNIKQIQALAEAYFT